MYWPSLNFSFTTNRFLTMEQIEIIHSVNLLISVMTHTLQLIILLKLKLDFWLVILIQEYWNKYISEAPFFTFLDSTYGNNIPNSIC